jgi:hypothetical protein
MNLFPKAAAMLLTMILGSPLHAASTGVPREVALTPGNCAQVTEGDILTLDWNPAFENPASVSGIADFHLAFGSPGESSSSRRRPSLVLETVHRGETVSSEPGIQPIPNGYFHLRFLVHLANVETGTYHLIDAQAVPILDPDFHGETPRMTNTPLNFPFCLNVIADARRRSASSL